MTKANSHHDPFRDTKNFLSELDRLVSRRPVGDSVLPAVLLMQKQSKQASVAQLIANYYWASADSKKPTIPHVLSVIDNPDYSDLALFSYICDNLKIPPSMGRFRFSNLKMVKDLLGITLDPDATDYDAKATDLVKKLYNKRHTKPDNGSGEIISTSAGHDGALGIVAIILEIRRRLRFKVFRTELATTNRYRWFSDSVAWERAEKDQVDEIPEDFLSCAVWTLEQPNLKNSALARKLMMLALFKDLEHVFKSPRINLSLHRRRRCTPFVITFKNVSPIDSAARRFLQTFGELIDQSKDTGLLILASVNGRAPSSLDADIDTFTTAAEKLQLIRRGRYESSTIPAFNIQANAPVKQAEKIRDFVANRPTPKPKFARGDFALPLFAGAILAPFIVLGILAGLIFFARAVPQLYQSTQHCKYMRPLKDRNRPYEIIGITDGSCSFLTETDRRGIGYIETHNSLQRKFYIARGFTADTFTYIKSLGQEKRRPLTAERLDYIHELNNAKQIIFSENQTLKNEDSSSYNTIVLLIPFTAPDESGHINQKTIGILRGVAVAQQEINRSADHVPAKSPEHLKLKILIANAGDSLMHGAKVANDIREINSRGSAPLGAKNTIIAVVGITQSLKNARDTVEPLTRDDTPNNPAIPVVGSTLTYDYMSGSDSLFYQASSPNLRQAQVLSEFIRHQPIVVDGTEQKPLKVARNLVIVNDEDDWYSQNLADDLYREFKSQTPEGANCPVLASWAVKKYMPNEDEKVYPAVKHKPASCNQTINSQIDPFIKYNRPTTVSLAHIQAELCDPANLPSFDQHSDIIVYTGRSAHFSTFLNALKPDVCARGRGFTIVAGSDIAQWEEYDAYKGFFPHLYFGAYGARDSINNGTIADSFFANPIVKDIVDQSGAARAYDSVKMLWPIVTQATIEKPTPLDIQITTAMFKKSLNEWPRIQSEGASGVIDIPKDKRVPLNRPVFIMRAGNSQPIMSCGIFSMGDPARINAHGRPFTETKWGDSLQFNCPVELDSPSP